MSRTNIDIDELLVNRVMERYRLRTKRQAVDYALRRLLGDHAPRDLLALESTGWEGDLDQMRAPFVDPS